MYYPKEFQSTGTKEGPGRDRVRTELHRRSIDPTKDQSRLFGERRPPQGSVRDELRHVHRGGQDCDDRGLSGLSSTLTDQSLEMAPAQWGHTWCGSWPGSMLSVSPHKSAFSTVSFITFPLTCWLTGRQNTPSTLTFRPPSSTPLINEHRIKGLPVSFLFSLWTISFSQSGKKPSCTDGLAQGLQGHQAGTHRANEEKLQIMWVQLPARKYKLQSPD